ncbi:MAG TPA: c-type cytochrome [Gemmatimonadaceae bacterium]
MTALYSAAMFALVLGACTRSPEASPSDSVRVDANAPVSAVSVRAAEVERVLLPVPSDSQIPAGPLGVSIRRGRALFEATRDSLPAHVGNRLRCLSCHLDGGRRANASPLVGAFLSYPTYNARAGRVYTIEDRINDCFRRSMAGRSLAAESAELRDMISYLAFLSRGIPAGEEVEGHGIPKIEPLVPDTARGSEIFASTCARCHGASGDGTTVAPPLWGTGSFSIGAGMARLRTAASFIRHNMPYDQPGTLTDQQAFDVAAYINSHPRPDLAGKENDWPNGDEPPDAAYPTRASRKQGAVAMTESR